MSFTTRRMTTLRRQLPAWVFRGINKHPSYNGVMTKKHAELILKLQNENYCYFIRYDKKEVSYVLSVKKIDPPKILHFKIKTSPNKDRKSLYEIKGAGKKFDLVSQLINFYLPGSTPEADWLCSIIQTTSDKNSTVETTLAKLKQHRFKYITKDGNVAILSTSFSTQFEATRTKEHSHVTTYARRSRKQVAISTKELVGINDHPSYHGLMTSVEAEEKLREHGGNCFLTRCSKDEFTYRLSVRTERSGEAAFHNFTLHIKTNKIDPDATYEIQGANMDFEDIFELLSFYQSHPLSHEVASIGECLQSKGRQLGHKAKNPWPEPVFKRRALHGAPLTMRHLKSIKWKDEDGLTHTFKLAERVSMKWRDIGLEIDLHVNTMNDYERQYQASASRCWEVVMQTWLDGQGQEEYPITWEGLYEMLGAVQSQRVAEELKKAVENAYIAKGTTL